MRALLEDGLVDSFQYAPHYFLNQFVIPGGDSEWSFLAVGFWDLRPSYWVETVTSVFESLDDGGNSCF